MTYLTTVQQDQSAAECLVTLDIYPTPGLLSRKTMGIIGETLDETVRIVELETNTVIRRHKVLIVLLVPNQSLYSHVYSVKLGSSKLGF